MATATERKAAQRQRERAAGLVPFSGMLHREQLADMTTVLHLLRSNADLRVASLRNTRTGKFQSLKERAKQ